MKIADAVAVITGAGSGIGRASAISLSRRGAKVVITDIDAARADAVAAQIGGTAVSARLDVTSQADFEAVRDLALDRHGRVDIVMNNVGVLAVGTVLDIPLEAWQRTVDINLMGIVRSNLVLLPLLIDQGHGHVINTASMAGLLPYAHDRLPYTATKHAVVGMTQSLAIYLRPLGVGVTLLCPAGVATNIMEQMTFYGERRPVTAPALPVADPSDVGELVADSVEQDRFLALPAPEAAAEVAELGADMDGYLARHTARS